MGNIAYITTRKHVKSYDMMSLLQDINQRRFDGKMTIRDHCEGWEISYQHWENAWETIWIHPESTRKVGAKHPHSVWMPYVFVVFLEELGALTNGVMSDEGVSERWKPNPKKYSSWDVWMKILHARSLQTNPEAAEQFIKLETSYVPNGMEKY
jgi:hypothetical protein